MFFNHVYAVVNENYAGSPTFDIIKIFKTFEGATWYIVREVLPKKTLMQQQSECLWTNTDECVEIRQIDFSND